MLDAFLRSLAGQWKTLRGCLKRASVRNVTSSVRVTGLVALLQ